MSRRAPVWVNRRCLTRSPPFLHSSISTVDNIYVGHSAADAKSFAKETYHVKVESEKEEEGAVEEDEDVEPKFSTIDAMKLRVLQFASEYHRLLSCGGPLLVSLHSREAVLIFIIAFTDLAREDPMHAIKAMPDVAAGLAASLTTILGMLAALFGLIGASKGPTIQVKKVSSVKAAAPVAPASKEEKVALEKAGVSTGASATGGTATKRTAAGKSD